MLRATAKFITVCSLLVAGSVGLYLCQKHDAAAEKLRKSEQRNAQLRQVIGRLKAEKRVADVIVTERTLGPNGQPETTTLLFVEYGRDGSPLPSKRFTVRGNVAHIDAMVVKFDGRYVEENDPLRGHSVALFTRLYGEDQAPEAAFRIDSPGQAPAVYRGPADPNQAAFEKQLWANFWKLADDAAYRKQMGVRVAQGEGVWCPFQPDRLYTLTLESDGGLNITSEPLKGIYREALKRSAGEQPTTGAL